MKKSPFVRIREKNSEIKELRGKLLDISMILGCLPDEINESLFEALSWKKSYMTAMVDNDTLRVKMGEQIQDQVDKITFNLQLENTKTKVEVEKLKKMLDTKDYEISSLRQRTQINKKGFWDFVYKVFKVV